MTANARQRGKMKKRLVAGGVIGGLAALIAWLAGMFSGMGLGLGSGGDGDGEGKTTNVKTQPTPPVKKVTAPDEKVVVVVIDEQGLRLRQSRDGRDVYSTIDYDAVLERAAKVAGDDKGTKVRVNFHGSGKRSIRQELLRRLRESGLKFEEIQPDF